MKHQSEMWKLRRVGSKPKSSKGHSIPFSANYSSSETPKPCLPLRMSGRNDSAEEESDPKPEKEIYCIYITSVAAKRI